MTDEQQRRFDFHVDHFREFIVPCLSDSNYDRFILTLEFAKWYESRLLAKDRKEPHAT